MSEQENNFVRRASDSISRFIRDVGFPIAVAAYLLMSLRPQIDRMQASLDKLVTMMETRR